MTREHLTRLSELMAAAGLTDPALAELAGTSKQQVFKLRKGDRKMSKEWADRLAPHLGVEWAELMEAANGAVPAPVAAPRRRLIMMAPQNIVPIPEYDLRRMDPGTERPPEDFKSYSHLGDWTLPIDALPGGRGVEPAIIRVIGDAMEPDYPAGSRVMVDISMRQIGSPGVYILRDEAGFTLKQVEHLVGSNPPIARISNINPRYAAYERPVEDVQVRGRVIGQWLWR